MRGRHVKGLWHVKVWVQILSITVNLVRVARFSFFPVLVIPLITLPVFVTLVGKFFIRGRLSTHRSSSKAFRKGPGCAAWSSSLTRLARRGCEGLNILSAKFL
jgi:hypothetical protein